MNPIERVHLDVDLSTHVQPLLELARYALEASHLNGELEAFSQRNTDWGRNVLELMRAHEPCGKHDVKTGVASVLWIVQQFLYEYEQPTHKGGKA